MRLEGKKIGFALTGSHCTLQKVINEMKNLKEQEGAVITPILSPSVEQENTKFGTAAGWKKQIADIVGTTAYISTIVGAEPIGPQSLYDVLLIAPCSGNTLAKLANGIVDTAVLMAGKAQLRNLKPVVLAISTNDGLGINAKNISQLLNTKNIYIVPFGQDNPSLKPNSLVADMSKIADTVVGALEGKQIQPILIKD